MNVKAILAEAIQIHKKHMRVGIPMNTNMGFKEALIANSVTSAFINRGFLCYPQFPYKKGAFDAIFLRYENIVLTEFKRLNNSSTLKSQASRMLEFAPDKE